jgi:hypothetical protein
MTVLVFPWVSQARERKEAIGIALGKIGKKYWTASSIRQTLMSEIARRCDIGLRSERTAAMAVENPRDRLTVLLRSLARLLRKLITK